MANRRGTDRKAEAQVGQPAERDRAWTAGWYLFLASIFFTPIMLGVIPPGISTFDPIGLPKVITFLALCGLSLAALSVSVALGKADLFWHPVLWIVLGLAGWAAISTLAVPNPYVSVLGHVNHWQGLVSYAGNALVAFLAIQYVRTTRHLRAALAAGVLSGSIVALYAVVQFLGMDAIRWVGETARTFSTFGNADMLGNYLVFPLALAIGLASSASFVRMRFVWWGATALIAVALLLTTTLGAWFGVAVMLGLFAVVLREGKQAAARQWLLLGAAAVVALCCAIAFALLIRPDIVARLTGPWSLWTRLTNGRDIIWVTGLRAWLTHPVLGWGPDQFGPAFQSAVRADWYALIPRVQIVFVAHSVLIQTLVTLGVVGLALWLWAVVSAAREGFAAARAAQGLNKPLLASPLMALTGVAAALSLGVSATIVSVCLWLAVGFVLASRARPVVVSLRLVMVGPALLGVALAVWAGSWAVADGFAGHALTLEPGPSQVAELRTAARVNPMQPYYRRLAADAIFQQAAAERQRGADDPAFDTTIRRAIAAYDEFIPADLRDVHIRVAEAELLAGYAGERLGADTAARAVEVALGATKLAPYNPTALAALAKAYKAAGRAVDADRTARLARSIAPAYSMQTLGSLGLDATATPVP